MKLLISGLAVSALGARTFGPNHCVSISQNEDTKTCVIQTNCKGYDIEDVEFAFTCKLPNMIQKHSFGKGGFDQEETFDTSVKCDACGLASEVGFALKKAKKIQKHIQKVEEEPAKAETKADAAKTVAKADTKVDVAKNATDSAKATAASANVTTVSYGPASCIKTWLKAEKAELKKQKGHDGQGGTCVVQTQCEAVNKKTPDTFTNYPVGFICMLNTKKDNKTSSVPVRHLFGTNSFDPSETFDTQIRCTECLGLDEVSEAVDLEGEVKGLSHRIEELEKAVGNVNKEVVKVEEKVEDVTTTTTTTTPKADEKAADDKAAQLFLNKKTEQKKRLRHTKPVEVAEEDVLEDETDADADDEPIVEDVYDADE